MPGNPGPTSSTSSSSQPFKSTSVLFDKGTVKEAVAALNQRASVTQTKSPFGAAGGVHSKSAAPQPPSDAANQASFSAAGEGKTSVSSAAGARYGACPDAEAVAANPDEPFVEPSASAGLYWLLTGKCCHRRREKPATSSASPPPSQVV
mmetsp:Transcript_22244/g.40958  ORF Transcript_22244/g.40958 Transcript_22244/m.40958 type:complete len:149 (-) Transcript_22244:103-549(-)